MGISGHPIFAALYDRLLAANEQAGLREMRAELLRSARGRTLEIGAGTGLNLRHYPAAVTDLVLSEPDPHMAKRLREAVNAAAPVDSVQVVEAGAEELPYASTSFDTVVSTLVLCTVERPEGAVSEIRRVLKPDGGALLTFFVLNDESRALIKAGKAALEFLDPDDHVAVVDADLPEEAVAYDEAWVRERLAGAEVRYGSWCGREEHTSFQDLVVATSTT